MPDPSRLIEMFSCNRMNLKLYSLWITLLLVALTESLWARGVHKLDYAYVPPAKVKSLVKQLDSTYARHQITLPDLTDTLGWLQIRMVSEEENVIWELYQKMPEKLGQPTTRSEGFALWKHIQVPELSAEKITVDYVYFGVSSYLSGRGTYTNTQLIWVNLRDKNNKNLLAEKNSYYYKLQDFFKQMLDSDE